MNPLDQLQPLIDPPPVPWWPPAPGWWWLAAALAERLGLRMVPEAMRARLADGFDLHRLTRPALG